MGAAHAIAILEALLLKFITLDEVFKLDDEFFELDNDELLDELFSVELIVDELDTGNELFAEDAEEEIFDALLLIAPLELNTTAELELIFIEELALDIFTLDAALDTAATADDIELLKFEAELLTTVIELALTFTAELLIEPGAVGVGEALPPPPPQALSNKGKNNIADAKKYGRKKLIKNSIGILGNDEI